MATVTAASLLSLSKQYQFAFEILLPKDKAWFHPDVPLSPAFNALGQAYELALKAYLAEEGFSEKALKNQFGHGLNELLKECRKRGLLSRCGISRWPTKAFNDLSDAHGSPHWLRYSSVRGTKSLPNAASLRSNLDKVIRGVDRFIRSKP